MKRRHFLLGLGALCVRGSARASSNWSALQAYNRQQGGVSLLVMQNGRVIYEDGGDRAYELASGTKSFWGTLAVTLDLDLDAPLGGVLTEWRGDARAQITLRQLLSLTSGIPGGSIGRPPTFAAALQVPQTFPAGSRFQYGPAPYQCFGSFLRRKFQTDPLQLLSTHLGVEYQDWKRGRDGEIHLPSGAKLTARSWANFGLWVLKNQQRLSACFQGTSANPAYGLTWWLKKPVSSSNTLQMRKAMGQIAELGNDPTLPEDIVMAAGAGDQRLYLIPSLNLVIVRQADRILGRMWSHSTNFSDRQFLSTALKSLQ